MDKALRLDREFAYLLPVQLFLEERIHRGDRGHTRCGGRTEADSRRHGRGKCDLYSRFFAPCTEDLCDRAAQRVQGCLCFEAAFDCFEARAVVFAGDPDVRPYHNLVFLCRAGIYCYALVYRRQYGRVAIDHKVFSKQDYLGRCRRLALGHTNTIEEYPTT